MEGEKQGRLGNLDKMTVIQLQELLDRQEKLLSKRNFLQTLPDKGQKIKDFATRLQQMISQKQNSALPQTCSHPPTSGKQQPLLENIQATSHSVRSFQSVTVHDTEDALPERDRVSLGDGEVVDGTEMLSDAIDSLVISELTAPRMADKHSNITENGGDLETGFPNSYERVMKRNENADSKRMPFKPNHSLKISDIHQLPEHYKHKSRSSAVESSGSQSVTQPADRRAEGRKKESIKVQYDSAVTVPDYKFKGAKEISVQESLVLQKQQKENLERIQTVHAAERLAERLNIKTLDYKPSALDMQYRSSGIDNDGNTYDSDDDSDDDNDDVPE